MTVSGTPMLSWRYRNILIPKQLERPPEMKDWLRSQATSVLRSNAWRRASTWIRGYRAPAAGHEIHDVKVPADIVAYFGDSDEKIYQLEQWLPVLEELNKSHRVVLIFRKLNALRALKRKTHLQKVFIRRFDDLITMYYENEYVLGLYVNNGVTNFQSLSYPQMVHVHVNHGESDKISMVSNQAKAYDKVFVAGQAAIERHRRALIDFDEDALVRVGRPQLDIPRESSLPPSNKRTILYAPTWEGENESNNYTSIDLYGPEIVEAALALPNVRLVYKPHPRVQDSSDETIAEADDRIRTLIHEANAEGGQHLIEMQGDILGMFDDVSLLITDISSVGLDFLYLHPETPLVLTDRRTQRSKLHTESPISRAAPILDASTIGQAKEMLNDLLGQDEFAAPRLEMRDFYFGMGETGSSTRKFFEAIGQLIAERKAQLRSYDVEGSNMEAED